MNTDLQSSPNGGPELGNRIRAHRKAKGLSIRELAAQSGLSNGMISQIEQGKSSPSLRSLRLISEVLKVPTATLFGTVPAPINADRGLAASCVVRRSARQVLKLNGAVLKELMSPASLHHLEIFNVELQPGGNSGPDLYSHTGEKAGIVLEGLLRLQLGEEIVELNAGDVCQFSGEIEHRYENAGTDVCKVIWVLTPPAG